MQQYDWNSIDREELGPGLARRVVHTERMTVARIYLDEGSRVASHQHENEQMTNLMEGRLRFIIDGEVTEIVAGQAIRIPPHAVHEVQALEDSVALDLFAPRREDWIRGDDSYLRR